LFIPTTIFFIIFALLHAVVLQLVTRKAYNSGIMEMSVTQLDTCPRRHYDIKSAATTNRAFVWLEFPWFRPIWVIYISIKKQMK
jgi:hypothetical protein